MVFRAAGRRELRDGAARMRDWYESLRRDTVVVAHGGSAGLMRIWIAQPAAAPIIDIEQGLVNVRSGKPPLHMIRN